MRVTNIIESSQKLSTEISIEPPVPIVHNLMMFKNSGVAKDGGVREL